MKRIITNCGTQMGADSHRNKEGSMDRPIAVGDLVFVKNILRCGCLHNYGEIFKVTHIRPSAGGKIGRCRGCTSMYSSVGGMVADGFRNYGIGIGRLQRIPPLDELEGQRTEENIKEPA